jgi:hypothetical protein
MGEDYDIHKHTEPAASNKKVYLGRYLLGLGIGIMIGVTQSTGSLGRKIWEFYT